VAIDNRVAINCWVFAEKTRLTRQGPSSFTFVPNFFWPYQAKSDKVEKIEKDADQPFIGLGLLEVLRNQLALT